jgi:hypothetical protein
MECMQELKAAQKNMTCSTQLLKRFTHCVVEQMKYLNQFMKLKALGAAGREKVKNEVVMKNWDSTSRAVKAFATLRSLVNAHTDAILSKSFRSAVHSAQQAAEVQREEFLHGPVAPAEMDLPNRGMHAFSTYQRTLQVTVSARKGDHQTVALQLCMIDHDKSMRAATAVRGCWEGALLYSTRRAAAHACILSSQNHAQIHDVYARVARNLLATAAADHATELSLSASTQPRRTWASSQRRTSDVPDLSPIPYHVVPANQMKTAGIDSKRLLTAGFAPVERLNHTHARAKSDYGAKRPSQPMVSTNNGPLSRKFATTQRKKYRQLSTQSLSPSPHASTSGMQHSQARRPTFAHLNSAPHEHLDSTAAKLSHSAKLFTSQHIAQQQAAYRQETHELNAALDKLYMSLQSLPKRLRSRAYSHQVPRTSTQGTKKAGSVQFSPASVDDKQYLAKPERKRHSESKTGFGGVQCEIGQAETAGQTDERSQSNKKTGMLPCSYGIAE